MFKKLITSKYLYIALNKCTTVPVTGGIVIVARTKLIYDRPRVPAPGLLYPAAACGYLYICLRPQSYNLLALNEIYEIYERLIFNNCYTRT
jgi:hypothetical protein